MRTLPSRPPAFAPMVFVGLLAAGCATHPDGPHGLACPAIEAASTIDLSSDRLRSLTNVAERRDLSQHEQTYLVNVIYYQGGLPDDQATALGTLIKNPCCTSETRTHIARDLRGVGFSDARRRVADALIENPGVAAAASDV